LRLSGFPLNEHVRTWCGCSRVDFKFTLGYYFLCRQCSVWWWFKVIRSHRSV